MSESFVVALTSDRIQFNHGILCSWDVIWGPTYTMSQQAALRFATREAAQEAADTANAICDYTAHRLLCRPCILTSRATVEALRPPVSGRAA